MSFDDRVTVAMVSDSLDALGYRDQTLHPGVVQMSGVASGCVIGRALTIQFAPAGAIDPPEPYNESIDFIDALTPGAFAVVSCAGFSASACWGELFSAAARGRGAVGMITDGFIRDLDRIRELGFPTFAAGTQPADYRGRMRVVARNARVTVSGVVIEPGDVVVGDCDGVAVVPGAIISEVARLANARALAESSVLSELLSGEGLRAVWSRHGVL